MNRYLATAIAAARCAGAIHKKYYGRDAKVRTKGKSYDLLTVADTESETAVVALIRRRFPGHNFLAEENVYPRSDSAFTWIIDPLDGTNNFACGIPIFCASVALRRGDEIVAGAVYDALRDELFSAAKGEGAFLNGRRIRVNRARTLEEALLITGFYYDRGRKMIEAVEAIKRFQLKKVLGVRRFGAAALDLSYVACGRAAGFWEFELSPWDFAAAMLLVREAGGTVTGLRGEEVPLDRRSFIVASNRTLHAPMLRVIRHA